MSFELLFYEILFLNRKFWKIFLIKAF